MDTGSSVSLVREDINTKIVDQQKFTKKCNILSEISKSRVLTKGTFEHDLVIDEDRYSLTWYVVPTSKLRSCDRHRHFGTSFLKVYRRWWCRVPQIGARKLSRPSLEAKGSIQEIKSENQRTYNKGNASFQVNQILYIG
ncbi:hypothetical protein NPIL_163461 [Nephila pilipes]|uniref:Peptidase A2 domain-containing protein n=1 Tax=Nephila pilipes TaxID=299642 RepID=A0A8X6Q1Z1_NEPPI|nr:hypothetical protein NPIL_163461 [Nephila pilipes]